MESPSQALLLAFAALVSVLVWYFASVADRDSREELSTDFRLALLDRAMDSAEVLAGGAHAGSLAFADLLSPFTYAAYESFATIETLVGKEGKGGGRMGLGWGGVWKAAGWGVKNAKGPQFRLQDLGFRVWDLGIGAYRLSMAYDIYDIFDIGRGDGVWIG